MNVSTRPFQHGSQKRQHRSVAWVTLLVLALVGVIVGCGAPSSSSSSATSSTTPSSPASTSVHSDQSDQKPAAQTELTISAAASLRDALQELEQQYESKHPHIMLKLNFGASGALQKQIEQGAPTDMFISAGKKQMDALLESNLIDDKWQRPLLQNDLVVIVPQDRKAEAAWSKLDSLEGDLVKRIAIGAPDSVPAGSYAKQALEHAGLWDKLNSKFVLTKDVRQVLSYVETGNVDAGFVYRTDALTSKKAAIAHTVDAASHKPIVYPIGIVKATANQAEVQQWYEFLLSDTAKTVFERHGFRTAE
ncbi:molybdate ABC transporter substrate-binding protein [Paenibacillus sp. 481]|uniref:molybdate ABC transporter substrate-binding protein n=1 Tax=Paenibacillus sp. 481 TaxID=2835869 RepID=UPI001E2CD949|nr:molybdate ABC transporter substrate-binding protein [Paenibacillus sp. 481]UHA71816.1 molybdate ABC transporter substrate-binding protein [Paenibacillus sp. 481]